MLYCMTETTLQPWNVCAVYIELTHLNEFNDIMSVVMNDEGSLCRQLDHKKLILPTFRLDALILLKAR